MAGEKNFFVSLFDVSFKEFVTPRMISFIYILIVVVLGLGTLIWLVTSLLVGQWWAIILAPIVFFINLIIIRMWLEMFMVFFRIMRQVDAIAGDKGVSGAATGGPVPPAPSGPIA